MFKNYISLGWYCGTADSMSKFGFRSISGPFDWIRSSLEDVLWLWENEFDGFMDKENLEFFPDEKVCINKKYDLEFPHEVKECFEDEFEGIYLKYCRRIERFYKRIKEPTCFLRAIRDEAEIYYIIENENRIKKLVKKANAENEIVFLIPLSLQCDARLPFKFFEVDSRVGIAPENSGFRFWGVTGGAYTRDIFDNRFDLLSYCCENIDEDIRKNNLLFDLKKMYSRTEKQYLKAKERYELTTKLLTTDFTGYIFPEKFIIYGAGSIGKLFCDKAYNKNAIECFVDAKPQEESYSDIPIISFSDICNTKSNTFIITVSYEYEAICNRIKSKIPQARILSLNYFLEHDQKILKEVIENK